MARRKKSIEEINAQERRIQALIDDNAMSEELRKARHEGINTGLRVADIDQLRNRARRNPQLAKELENDAVRYVSRNNRLANMAADARRNAQVKANASNAG